MNLRDIRQQFPQYNDLSDQQLADAFYEKFYSDMDRTEFDAKLNTRSQTVLGKAGDFISGVASDVAGAITGQQDPKEANTPTFDPFEASYPGSGSEGVASLNRAGFYALTDDALADVTAKKLGPAFIRMERDKNNYPIVVYRGRDGGEERRYINQPGLDMGDVRRGFEAAVPYIAGGAGAGALLKGAGKAANAIGLGISQTGVSGAQDAIAASEGSEQGFDIGRAAATGLLGAASPYVSLPVMGTALGGVIGATAEGTPEERAAKAVIGMGAGYAGGRTVNRLTKGRDPAEAVQDGKIVDPALRGRAERAGVNMDDLTPEEAQTFARAAPHSRDDVELATMIETQRFGIPTTKATRTKDVQQSLLEKDMRAGSIGEDAQRILKDFDRQQKQAIQSSALQRQSLMVDDVDPVKLMRERAAGKPGDPYKEGIGAMINPQRGATRPEDVAPGVLGEAIQGGLKQMREAGETAINQAFKQVDEIIPAPQAFDTLRSTITSKIGDLPIDKELTPAAAKMADDLMAFMENRAITPQAAGIVERGPVKDVDAVRRRLLKFRMAAKDDTDRAASRAIYDGFNDWIDDIAERGLIQGNEAPAKAAALRTARTLTREVKSMFEPRAKAGAPNPAKNILREIVDGENNADSVIQILFGGQTPKSPPKKGAEAAVRQIKKALFEGVEREPGKRSGLIPPDEALRVWNDLRIAGWSRLVVGKDGQMMSPDVILGNINSALRNQGKVMQAMYSPYEIGVMKQYARTLEKAGFKDPNPSGTATGVLAQSLRNPSNVIGRSGKMGAQTQMKRETFSKGNHVAAAFWRHLAREFPVDIFGLKATVRERAARDAIRQEIKQLLAPTQGGIKSGAGAIADQQDAVPFN